MELLILLLERRGNVVSRQEIVERLWGKDVFVDTEHGINVAIRKIRTALHDDAEKPQFIHTVLGKGYRFVADSKPQVELPEAKESFPPPNVAPAQVISHPQSLPPKRSHARFTIAALVTIAVLLVAVVFAFDVGGERSRLLATNSSRQISSIAVIPIVNLSGDPAQDYFADGMTDEIITNLAKFSSLRVVSRTSAMQYKNAKLPVGEIAHQLGVDGILEGSVERTGNHIHMTVQLIHAPSDSHIWAESYDRDFADAFAIPVELSQTLAKKISRSTRAVEATKGINPKAHDAYLQGRYFWFANNNLRSIENFKRAIQLQPDYALAWGGLADAYLVQAVDNELPLKDVLDKADEAGRKAVELDDSSAEVHNSMAGLYLFGHWDPKRADQEALQSIALNPNHAEIHHLRAYILYALNRPDEALQEQKRCTELDRFARPWALGRVLEMQRRFDDAIREYKVLLEAQSQDNFGWFLLSDVYLLKHMDADYVSFRAKALRNIGAETAALELEETYRSGGANSVKLLELAESKRKAEKKYVSPFELATLAAHLERKQETLKYLEAAYDEHTPWLVLVQWEPDFDFLHSDPRYQALVRKIGLEPAY